MIANIETERGKKQLKAEAGCISSAKMGRRSRNNQQLRENNRCNYTDVPVSVSQAKYNLLEKMKSWLI